MAPSGVVPRLDVPEDRTPRVLPGVPIVLAEQFELEGGEEAFRHRVVVTVALAAHARQHPVRHHRAPVLTRRVLTASIRMVDQPRGWPTGVPRHPEGAEDELDLHRVLHRPPPTPARSEIEHGRQVQRAFPRRDVRNIGDPDPIDGDAVHIELAREPVRRDRLVVSRIGGGDAPPLARARHQSVLAHEARDPLRAGRQPLGLQLPVHPGRAVRLATRVVGDPHVRHQDLVDQRVPTRRSLPRGVVARGPHLEDPAHESHFELAPMARDHGVPQRDSFAKYTATFFAKACSCRSTAFSRRNRRTSWSSDSPDTAPPGLGAVRACRVHARS